MTKAEKRSRREAGFGALRAEGGGRTAHCGAPYYDMVSPSPDRLEELLLNTADLYFAGAPFARDEMITTTQRRARILGWWLLEPESAHDGNGAVSKESIVAIDSVFSNLAERGVLVSTGKNLWRVTGPTRKSHSGIAD